MATKLSINDLWDPAQTEAMAKCIEGIESNGGEATDEQQQEAAKVLKVFVGFLQDELSEVKQIELVLPTLRKLSGSGLLDDTSKASAETAITFFGSWHPLLESVDKWSSLGTTNIDRKQHPNAKHMMKAVIANLKKLEEQRDRLASCSLSAVHTEVRNSVLKIQDEILGHESPILAEALSTLEPVAEGGEETGKKWTDQLSGDEEVTEEKVFAVVMKILIPMDGPAFSNKISRLEAALESWSSWHESFDKGCDEATEKAVETVIKQAKATKYQALMVHASVEHSENPMGLRRAIKKYRSAADASQAFFHPLVWQWSGVVSSLNARA
jgi:hypothetical protein